MIVLKIRKKYRKLIALVSMFTLVFQLLFPVAAHALTSGPSQPEMQSFEPVGTTDMVDLFTGNFMYNIPLLDVDGYPVNISYHSGINMEQESSWVGLGWNINPGNINHMVRGISDDFAGDKIEKTLEIEPEKNDRVNLFLGVELAGFETDKLSKAAKEALKNLGSTIGPSQLDFGLNISNYTGVSASIGKSNMIKIPYTSVGVNLGATVSTNSGTDFDYSLTYSSRALSVVNSSLTLSGSINSREGVKYTSFGVNASVNMGNVVSYSNSADKTIVPIGLQNYVPVITNASFARSNFFRIKVGGEIWMIYPYGGGSYASHKVEFDSDGTRKSYGYFNLDQAGPADVMDFTREKDGRTHRKSRYLPMASMTYDIYSVSGQGTGGSFRPLRNDIGTVYDPEIGGNAHDNSHLGEVGFGNVVEGGYDYKSATTESHSGPWKDNHKQFRSKQINDLFEPFIFKQAGELTSRNEALFNEIGGNAVLPYKDAKSLAKGQSTNVPGTRVPRANLLYFLNAKDASKYGISSEPKIENYPANHFRKYGQGSNVTYINRTDDERKEHHASQFNQILPDGRRYIYGIPAVNKQQKEYEFSCEPPSISNAGTDIVSHTYTSGKPSKYNGGLAQEYLSETITPTYAHSYLLTAVLPSDYTDLTGDGVTDDDLGNFTKFNYSRVVSDYYWRAPYKMSEAQYNRGVKSDCNDDKASFSAGKREEWLLHSITTRNYVAEFYTSVRLDGLGTDEDVVLSGNNASDRSKSYKLDSIVLYNKRERYEEQYAVPLKKIVFSYDYSLCKGVPNTSGGSGNNGKLTLKAIYIKNGNSQMGYLSPYKFKYDNGTNLSVYNPDYNFSAKDCWGSYKPTNANSVSAGLNLTNSEFPYVVQNDVNADKYANAWNLRQIQLPSGGSINVKYESDDYSFVQNKQAMEMVKVEGVGPSPTFTANNTLYKNFEEPYLYIYFRREQSNELYTDIRRSYFGDETILQYNFEIELSPGSLGSCNNMPLVEPVKGYGKILGAGICGGNSTYGYVKLEAKTPNAIPALSQLGVPNAKISPITLSALNFARYYNSKALKPESEITSTNPGEVISSLTSSIGSFINFFENPLKTYLKKDKAKTFTIDRSYIRIISPGLKKKGGGHRVKAIEFWDNWEEAGTTAAKYGSNYDYTIFDEGSGKKISSGVASYEPLYGGNENPCRILLNSDPSGNNSKFPPVDPIELLQEGPLGESFYPSPVVGYSKVTVTSMHKDEGQSSQTIQESEFYTAREFPAYSENNSIEVIEDKKPKFLDILNKKEVYRVAQGFKVVLNDMHGKPKKQSKWVAKYDPDPANMNAVTDSRELVSYTKYDYFTDPDGRLNNKIPCLEFNDNGIPALTERTLGEETDFTIDSREKTENTSFMNAMLSVNVFLAPPLPIGVPVAFPTFKKQSSTFSSLVNTKVIQKYGIIKSVESFDKGAKVVVENQAFDSKTGDVLVTKMNTEFNDNEYVVKYPAYWAYRCMGSAYENILYEESIPGRSPIFKHQLFLEVDDVDRYNLGDELELKGKLSCANQGQGTDEGVYKVWVVDKKKLPLLPSTFACTSTPCPPPAGQDVNYTLNGSTCVSWSDLKTIMDNYSGNSAFQNMTVPPERVVIDHDVTFKFKKNWSHGGWPCRIRWTDEILSIAEEDSVFTCNVTQNYITNNPTLVPLMSSHYLKVVYDKILDYHYESDVVSPPGPLFSFPIAKMTVQYPANSSSTTFPSCISTYSQIKELNYIHLQAWPCDRMLHTWYRNHQVGTCSNIARTASPQPMCIVVMPQKMNEMSLNGQGEHWHQERFFWNPSIKVIRSGKRNQLSEQVQEVRTLDNPIVNGLLVSEFPKTISSWAKWYRYTTHLPEDVQDPVLHPEYFTWWNTSNPNEPIPGNQYAYGRLGNFRASDDYLPHRDRNYNQNYQSDKERGTYALTGANALAWMFGNVPNDLYDRMQFNTSGNWRAKLTTPQFNSFGKPVQHNDEKGIQHGYLWGYNNDLMIAEGYDAASSEMLYDNFEDYRYRLYNVGTLGFVNYHNNLRRVIHADIDEATLEGPNFKIVEGGHTGTKALSVLDADAEVGLPVGIPYNEYNSAGRLWPFHFRDPQRYLVSVWEKVSGTTIPANSTLKLTHENATFLLAPKTPIIDGWVLYEGWATLPTVTTISGKTVRIKFSGTCVVDDIRIMAPQSNMKCYVYHPSTRKLMAILDENHFASIYEYDNEGNLQRIKKETEKGILTLKESRRALRNMLLNGTAPGGNVNWD